MAFLIIGMLLFIANHSVRIVAPAWREAKIAEIGEGTWKGIYSIVSIMGFVLIIYGFGQARQDVSQLYDPLPMGRGLTLIAIPIALWLWIASQFPPGYLKKALRHPMLIATILWAVVHLTANGDAASVVLFGGFFVWAVVNLVSCYGRPSGGDIKPVIWPDIASLVLAILVAGFFVSLGHEWLIGVSIT